MLDTRTMADERAEALAKARRLILELEQRQAEAAQLIDEIDALLQASVSVSPAGDRRKTPREE